MVDAPEEEDDPILRLQPETATCFGAINPSDRDLLVEPNRSEQELASGDAEVLLQVCHGFARVRDQDMGQTADDSPIGKAE